MDPAHARPRLAVTVPVELNARIIQLSRSGLRPHCPRCDNPLDLHQPDENSPEDLLATCDSCSGWFFVWQTGRQGRDLLLLELPSREAIEDLIDKNPPLPG